MRGRRGGVCGSAYLRYIGEMATTVLTGAAWEGCYVYGYSITYGMSMYGGRGVYISILLSVLHMYKFLRVRVIKGWG